MRYYVEISSQDGRFQGCVQDSARRRAKRQLTNVQLGREAEIVVNGFTRTLGDVVDALINFRLSDFDERAQLDVGQYLYRQIFDTQYVSELRQSDDDEDHLEIRIISNDEHVRRLPWALLAHEGDFLSACNCSVALARHSADADCTLPPLPRLLVVMPQPKKWNPTGAAEHLQQIKEMLAPVRERQAGAAVSVYEETGYLRVAHDWDTFRQSVMEFEPHLIYYYGHGKGDEHTSRLIFTDAERNPLEKPILDVADFLRSRQQTTKLIYLNCCSGDTGGHLGAGGQLADMIPAVVANCTLAQVEAAQAQGLVFLESLILHGKPPHQAVAELRRDVSRPELQLSFQDTNWMTPVIYCDYDKWFYEPPQLDDGGLGEVRRQAKLDRSRQFGFVLGQASEMLQDGRPRTLSYVWYGQRGQGVLKFHERINLEINQRLQRVAFFSLETKWPSHFEGSDPFIEMFTEPLDIYKLSHLPARIREKAGGPPESKILVYVSHSAIESRAFFGPAQLKKYLDWWDRQTALLSDPNIFYLLGLPFIVSNPEAFNQAVSHEVKRTLDLRSTRFRLLDEMGSVTVDDIIDYFEVYHHEVSLTVRGDTAQKIWEQTQGKYEETVEALLTPQFYYAPDDGRATSYDY